MDPTGRSIRTRTNPALGAVIAMLGIFAARRRAAHAARAAVQPAGAAVACPTTTWTAPASTSPATR